MSVMGKGVGISKPGFFAWPVTHPWEGARGAGAVRSMRRSTSLRFHQMLKGSKGPSWSRLAACCGVSAVLWGAVVPLWVLFCVWSDSVGTRAAKGLWVPLQLPSPRLL